MQVTAAEILDELDADGDNDVEVAEGWKALKDLILKYRDEVKSKERMAAFNL